MPVLDAAIKTSRARFRSGVMLTVKPAPKSPEPANNYRMRGRYRPAGFSKKYAIVIMYARFLKLVDRWRADTLVESSYTKIVGHPAYQEIASMNDKESVLRWVLRELRDNEEDWFVALEQLAGLNPLPKDRRLSFDEARALWLDWGRTRGLIG